MSKKDAIVGSPIEIVTAGFEELTGAVGRLDPALLRRLKVRIPVRKQALQTIATEQPQHAPLINKVLLPLMNAQKKVASAASGAVAAQNAAAARRVKDSADILESATHIIPINVDALADAGSVTGEIATPYSGQPWRYLGAMAATTAGVGTRFTTFELAGVNHVVTSNVDLSVSPTAPGIDLAFFGVNNVLAGFLPSFRYRPWGLKRNGVIRPDGVINLGLANRSGAAASLFVGLMVQASPCGEGYNTDRTGVYGAKDKHAKMFMNRMLRFSLFG